MRKKNQRSKRRNQQQPNSEPLKLWTNFIRDQEQPSSEESNKMTSDSVETVPKNAKKDRGRTLSKPIEDVKTCGPQEIRTQQEIVRHQQQLWESQINFQYFFRTLKDHPQEKLPKILSEKEEQMMEVDFSIEQEDDLPLLSKKKKQDMDWQSRCFSTKLVVNEENRRKSSRLEQIYQKERLENQMRDMRAAYYRGKYRYNIKEVRYRLSYLHANCHPYEVYQCQTIEDLPPEPPFTKFPTQKKNMIIQFMKQNLQNRIISQPQLSPKRS